MFKGKRDTWDYFVRVYLERRVMRLRRIMRLVNTEIPEIRRIIRQTNSTKAHLTDTLYDSVV